MDGKYILGIHDGHNCGATLTHNGTVIASISEERLVRRKNAVGYPRKSIEAVLQLGGIDPKNLSEIAYASLFMHAPSVLEDVATWYPVGMHEQLADAGKPKEYEKIIFEQRKNERIQSVTTHLGISGNSIHFVEHHLAHLAAAYYGSSVANGGKPVLGLTCDGSGDGICATVSICAGSKIDRIAETRRSASLGKIYSRITYLMGMTPWEHEYKLMGLAPYADLDHVERATEPLRKLVKLSQDGMTFELVGELSTNYCYEYLRKEFERVRFDAIAGAAQLFTEEMLVKWVRACIRHTGISDIVCGGGVFMNVKANMLIAQLPELSSIFVMPSASDESLSVGACFQRYYGAGARTIDGTSRITDLYWGGADDSTAEVAAIESARQTSKLKVSKPSDMNGAIADLLAAGEIVAVCRGRMEWGARALGNRSILASADDFRRVDVINNMIKMRDFWMPFAPSIKDESSRRYFTDDKGINPHFMTFAFPTIGSQGDLAAAFHPRDHTIRPQVVTTSANANYHAVLDRFEKRTGRGGILNTSFNLHGEPIVASSHDAIRVLQKSGLRHLALNNHILSKET